MQQFAGKHILLGVTGSIATYKAVGLASHLTQQGALVDVIMTEAACKMVQPLSFQAITHRPVLTDMWSLLAETEIGHVTLAKQADAMLVAPATANSIAKLALGFADNFLTTTALALRGALVLAPAMESGMWENPATQAHVATLRQRGAWLVEPDSGYLASGASGVGRLASEARLFATLEQALGPNDLRGLHLVVTAGGTQEAIDPVRFVANHSSGRMGYALAEAAARRGATVTLISGPVALEPPSGVRVLRVESAREMERAVLDAIGGADALLMAAAVADYRPAQVAEQKIKKGNGRPLAPADAQPGHPAQRQSGQARLADRRWLGRGKPGFAPKRARQTPAQSPRPPRCQPGAAKLRRRPGPGHPHPPRPRRAARPDEQARPRRPPAGRGQAPAGGSVEIGD